MNGFSAALLWLFVINLGIAFGVGLYVSRVVLSEWGGIAREMWPNTGLKFLGLCDNRPADTSHIGEPLGGMAKHRPRACLVARGSGHHRGGAKRPFIHASQSTAVPTVRQTARLGSEASGPKAPPVSQFGNWD